jgi:hypothetical protein
MFCLPHPALLLGARDAKAVKLNVERRPANREQQPVFLSFGLGHAHSSHKTIDFETPI